MLDMAYCYHLGHVYMRISSGPQMLIRMGVNTGSFMFAAVTMAVVPHPQLVLDLKLLESMQLGIPGPVGPSKSTPGL